MIMAVTSTTVASVGFSITAMGSRHDWLKRPTTKYENPRNFKGREFHIKKTVKNLMTYNDFHHT